MEEQLPSESLKKNKPKFMVLTVVGLLILVAGAGIYFFKVKNGSSRKVGFEETKFIQADFVDLDKIYSISKFRSGSGHDFSKGKGETCRSMKHYFATQWTEASEAARNSNNGLPPEPDGKTDISIFSPVDGEVLGIQSEKTPIGKQIYIRPDNSPSSTIRLFHIYLDDGFAKGTKLKAGQKIGKIGQYSTTDIAIMADGGFKSYFEVMPESIFAKYIARGIKSADDLIITKEYRDSHPLQCKGENFAVNYDSDPSSGNYVYLSGYAGETGAGTTSIPTDTTNTTTETPSASTENSSTAGSGGGGTGGGNGSGGGAGRR